MSESQRVRRSRPKSDRAEGAKRDAGGGPSRAAATHAPAWASNHVGAPFGLAGVQRKMTIGPAGDAYEREADRVSAEVASGRAIGPSAISPIGAHTAAPPAPVSQRAAAPDDKKKDEKPKAPAVQKAAAPEDKKKDEKPKAPAVQKAAAPEDKKKDEKPKAPAVQKAAAPEDKKKDEKPKAPAVQKAAAPQDKKNDEKPKAPAVQKAAAPEDKKKDEKPKAPTVQKAAAPEDKKKEEKPKAPAVQKAAAPEDKKKDEKPKAPAVQKAAAPEDKKKEENPKAPAIQKAAAPDDKKKDEKPKAPAVQKAAAPDGKKDDKKKDEKPKAAPVQKAGPKEAPGTPKEKKKEDDKGVDEKLKSAPIQRGAHDAGAAPTPSMESAASHAVQTKGAGEPLNAGTRNTLESRMGADLSGVRVHNDRAAHDTADAINARAFTHGRDIWLGHGQSQADTALMAHEATHVVQQAGGVQRMLVQRKDDAPADDDWDFTNKLGKIKAKGKDKKIALPQLQVPTFKKADTEKELPVTLPKKDPDEERTNTQLADWEKEASTGKAIEDKVDKKIASAAPIQDEKGQGDPIYFLQLKGGQNVYVIGTKATIKQRVLRPFWDKGGDAKPFHVDHKKELQLTHEEKGGDAGKIDNLWLLEAEANVASGQNIKAEKAAKIMALLDAASKKPKKKEKGKGKGADPEPPPAAKEEDAVDKSKPIFDTPPDLAEVRQEYRITFDKVVGGLEPKGTPKTWKIDDIREKAAQVDHLQGLKKSDIDKKHLQGTATELAIYTNEAGGGKREVKGWKEGKKEQTVDLRWGKHKDKGLNVHTIEYDETTRTGTLKGTAFKGGKLIEETDISLDIREMPGIQFGGAIPPASVYSALKTALKVPGASPVELDKVELTEQGFVGRGRVLPTIPLIKDVAIELVLDGDDVYLSKTFSAGDFKFPGPIKVTASSLEIFAGTKIGVRGDVFFEIERVGRGKISGTADVQKGFAIEGQFDFDSEMFEPAFVKVWYRDDKFGGEGELGIPEGKVKGIRSANLKARIDGDAISASGSVKPSIPGVEQGDLTFSHDPVNGVVIAGKLELKKDIPGLEGGSVSAELAKRPGEEKWKVKATGEATPKIPGVSSKLLVTYDDGAFDAMVTAGYEKGMLKGSITVGATNRPMGDDGKPAGPPPEKGADKITIYGGGSVTLKIAPWLQATAAIKLLPNGEVEVTGKIGLPALIELFPEKKLDKNIFKIGIDIPIIGVAAAGQRIGIFANISGGLDLSAGIGPGQLQQLELSVTYNPAHEDETKVVGDAKLHIPAMAGLRLFVRGSLGVGIPLVSASAGLEIGGMLGLEGALDAGVHVEWTPTKGLDIQAEASVFVEPKLKFDITGFVLVELDLLLTTIELYSQKWQLASFEYGSGLRLGMKFPIHYQEGKSFDVSLSDVQFEYPRIDPGELLEGLIKKIA